jgi:drug/metabolite transporter (DMT)-like permease
MSFVTGLVMLLSAVLLWSSSFTVVKIAVTTLPPSLLIAVFATIGSLGLAWVKLDRKVVRYGAVLGVIFFVAIALQTLGIERTTASKAAFITASCALVVPLINAVFLKHRVPSRVFVSLLLALLGLGMMTLKGQQGVSLGDGYLMVAAAVFAVMIVFVSEVTAQVNAFALVRVQFSVTAVLAFMWSFLPLRGEVVTRLLELPFTVWLALIYLGLCVHVVPSLLQTYALRVVPSYIAGLIYILEPVFGSLIAFFFLDELFGLFDWIGVTIVLVALAFGVQLPQRAWTKEIGQDGDGGLEQS